MGEAIRLLNLDGIETYRDLVTLFATLPRLDRGRALKLADAMGQRGQAEKLELLLTLFDLFLARLARAGMLGFAGAEAAPGETELFARLAPSPDAARSWAGLHQSLGARARHARAVNLDPAALVLDMILKVDETARATAFA